MSYCENYPLTNGFGSEPAALIRNRIDTARCINECQINTCDNFISIIASTPTSNGLDNGSLLVTITGGTTPYNLTLMNIGNQSGNGPQFTFPNLPCGTYNLMISDSSIPPCTSDIDLNIRASVGDIDLIRISGGPCQIDRLVPLSAIDFWTLFNTSVHPIPQGIPAVLLPTHSTYTITADLTLDGSYNTFYEAFGTVFPGGTMVNPQTVVVGISQFGAGSLPLNLGNTIIG